MALVTRVFFTSKSEKLFVIQKLINLRPLFSHHHQPFMTLMCSERFYRWLLRVCLSLGGIFYGELILFLAKLRIELDVDGAAAAGEVASRQHPSKSNED